MVADVSVSVPTMLSVGEGEGMVVICVLLSAPSDTERNFSVTLTTNSDTGMPCHISQTLWPRQFHLAMEDIDYIFVPSDVTYPSGSTDGTPNCVNISITDDAALEGNQTFIVMLTTSDPDVLLGNDLTITSISDDDGMLTREPRV